MSESSVTNKPVDKILNTTSVNLMEFAYEWKIINHEYLNLSYMECLTSPEFSFEDGDTKCVLSIYPNYYQLKTNNHSLVYLDVKVMNEVKILKGKVECNIIASDGKKEIVSSEFHNNNALLAVMTTTQLNALHDPLILVLKFFIVSDITVSIVSSVNDSVGPNDQFQVSSYERFFVNQEFCDIVLVASGKEILAHKLILAAHSPVFFTMLSNNMKEKKESKIVFTDVDHEVLQEALNFIYSRKMNDLSNKAFELLAMANKYDITGLKSTCEQYLCKRMTIDNLVDILNAADLYNATKLKKRAIQFFVDHGKGITLMEHLKSFNNVQEDTIEEIKSKLSLL